MRLASFGILLAILPAKAAFGDVVTVLPFDSGVRLNPHFEAVTLEHEGAQVEFFSNRDVTRKEVDPSLRPYVLHGSLQAEAECRKIFSTISEELLAIDGTRVTLESMMQCYRLGDVSFATYTASVEPYTVDDVSYLEEHVGARQGSVYWGHTFTFRKAATIVDLPEFNYFDVEWEGSLPQDATPIYAKRPDHHVSWTNRLEVERSLDAIAARVEGDVKGFAELLREIFGEDEAQYVLTGIFAKTKTVVITWRPAFVLEDESVVPFPVMRQMVRDCKSSPTGYCG